MQYIEQFVKLRQEIKPLRTSVSYFCTFPRNVYGVSVIRFALQICTPMKCDGTCSEPLLPLCLWTATCFLFQNLLPQHKVYTYEEIQLLQQRLTGVVGSNTTSVKLS